MQTKHVGSNWVLVLKDGNHCVTFTIVMKGLILHGTPQRSCMQLTRYARQIISQLLYNLVCRLVTKHLLVCQFGGSLQTGLLHPFKFYEHWCLKGFTAQITITIHQFLSRASRKSYFYYCYRSIEQIFL